MAMSKLDAALLGIGTIEALATQDSPIHRLDPRAKVVTTFAFLITVVSYDKYALSAMIPLALYPVAIMSLAQLPPGFLVRKLLWASPFALAIGLFNPWLDRATVVQLGTLEISGGWVSYASILLRFLFTLSAALLLIGSTSLNDVCLALARLKAPRVFTVQLMLLFRYLFVLAHEAARTLRAWSLRATAARRISWRLFTLLSGRLLLRALDRAHHIYSAMLSRGFDGEIRSSRPLHFRGADLLYVIGWLAFFVLVRCFNLPQYLGHGAIEALQ